MSNCPGSSYSKVEFHKIWKDQFSLCYCPFICFAASFHNYALVKRMFSNLKLLFSNQTQHQQGHIFNQRQKAESVPWVSEQDLCHFASPQCKAFIRHITFSVYEDYCSVLCVLDSTLSYIVTTILLLIVWFCLI